MRVTVTGLLVATAGACWLSGSGLATASAATVSAASASVAPGPAAATGARAHKPAATSGAVTVRGWGSNDDGALGAGSGALTSAVPITVKVPKGVTVTTVRAGCDDSVALTSAGGVLAWGNNTFGEVGDGTTKKRGTPVSVKLPKGTKATAVRAGCDDNIALTRAGAVLAWGLGTQGELGNGKAKSSDVPVEVKLPKDAKVKAISAGCEHNLALTTTGQLYAWGANGDGQLGDGTHKQRRNPVLVKLPAGTTATMAAAGCEHSLALTSTGLYAWGSNSSGQLGTGDMKNHASPVLIPLLFRGTGPGTITSLFAGCSHSMALFSKGAVLAWGDDSDGQLGDGGSTPSVKPVAVMLPATVTVKSISAGCDDGYALSTDGEVFAWGLGAGGELGDASASNSHLPVAVHLLTKVDPAAIGAGPGALHAFVIARTHPG
jgi:alpha-tubulin suppressor-like RCC1 family protein